MLQQIRWRQEHVRAEAGATALGVSKAATGALLSTTVFPRRPSLRYNKQMLHRSLQTARMRTVLPAPAQDQPRLVQFPPVKTAALLSHRSGAGMMLAISSAMLVVCEVQRLERTYTNTLPRSLLQASRYPPARCNEEARDQTSKTGRPCW